MKPIRVAINGFGRIGRAFVRRSQGRGIEIVAINDLGTLESLSYLLKYDSVYRRAPFSVEAKSFPPAGSSEAGEPVAGAAAAPAVPIGAPASVGGPEAVGVAPTVGKPSGELVIGGVSAKFFSEKDPANLPWKDLDVDVVVEATGFFTDYAKAGAHITAGAKRVVITAPAKGDASAGAMVLMGINEGDLKTCKVSSNASCTTNSASPVIAILDEAIGIEKAILSTTHAYTASQAIVDGPSKKDVKEGRAAAVNIVPTSTGAAVSVATVYKPLAGKFDGISLRVPVPAGSIADITFIAKRPTTVEEVNAALAAAAKDPRWEGIFTVTDEEFVSSDIVGEAHASIADLGMTRVVDGNLVKVLAWYDNEMGYTESLVRHVLKAAEASAS